MRLDLAPWAYINPAAEICAKAGKAGARVFVDAARSAPHVSLDVQAMGCDFLVFSSHKMMGPMGAGVLWARAGMLGEMPPYQAGSNMAHEVDVEGQTFEHGARKFGAGTPNVTGPPGLAAAVRCMQLRRPGVSLPDPSLLHRGACLIEMSS